MRAITKGAGPASLTAYRQTRRCSYDGYKDKDGLRNALVTEQRGICCYCMSRIRSNSASMKIEHWRCQANHSSKQLDYGNLLGACWGGDGQPQHLQHCDTRKGDRDLKWNPSNSAHRIESRIQYEPDGRIRSSNVEFDSELQDVLNLNLSNLRNSRKGVLDSILDWWRSEKARLNGPVSRARLEMKRAEWAGAAGDLIPFCQVAVWWLDQRLNKMPA